MPLSHGAGRQAMSSSLDTPSSNCPGRCLRQLSTTKGRRTNSSSADTQGQIFPHPCDVTTTITPALAGAPESPHQGSARWRTALLSKIPTVCGLHVPTAHQKSPWLLVRGHSAARGWLGPEEPGGCRVVLQDLDPPGRPYRLIQQPLHQDTSSDWLCRLFRCADKA